MKANLLEALAYLWPTGINDPRMHRDVIRVYSMGWLDALLEFGMVAQAALWREQYAQMADENWWPDATWRWWP